MIGLADFRGDWALSRRISDARAGHSGRFDGRARFREDGDALLYAEEGRLVLPGQPPFTAARRYLWRAAAGRIAVLFDDGRPFHTFDPGAGAPMARHDCPPDTYDVCYDFTAWPLWRATWSVTGPRKDYVMESCYAPGAGAETGQ